MANLTVRAENNNLPHFPHYGNHKVSIFNTLIPQRLNLLAQKHNLKFRVSCSITERQKKEAEEKKIILNGLKVNELGKNEGLISTCGNELGTESGDKEVGFEWRWPPWKNLPQRYKLIGTTSLAFVICNMDKVSVGPPLASILVTSIASQFSNSLISKGVDTSLVRKICQTIAFLSPATCMILSSVDFGLPPWEVVTILTGGLALSSFALSGLYCTHQDISPEYASILLGITNTVGAVPGIVGVALSGYLLDSTHSWSVSHLMFPRVPSNLSLVRLKTSS